MTSNIKIGLTSGTLTDVTTLSGDAEVPYTQFRTWTVTLPTGDGLERGMGRPWAAWTWLVIPPLLRNVFRTTYCPAPQKSARVYIQTVNSLANGTVAIYQAAMLWPDHDNLYSSSSGQIAYSSGDTSSFTIEFRDLVLVP